MTDKSAAVFEAGLLDQIARGELAGVTTRVWREGQLVSETTVGCRDVARRLPMSRDTIFRIASLTKPLTTMAALVMVDEGRVRLDEPIQRWAPELAGMRVLDDVEGPLQRTHAAERAISFRDLLTHRSGLTYGDFHHGAIGAAYRDALGAQIDNPLSPDEWIGRLAALPLIDQPGAGFHYGVSTDLLGCLLTRIEDRSLGDILRQRVLDPLRMHDTGFVLPLEKRGRCASLTGFDDSGRLATLEVAPGGHARAERPADMTFESGGQGLWSTADDYLTFARLLIGGGAVDGVRILSPHSSTLMTMNQLTVAQRASARLLGQAVFAEGHGYGMGVAVVLEPHAADPLRCRGGVGTIGWPGAYGSWWQADPTCDAVLIFMSHNMVELSQLAQGIGLGTWHAIAAFHRLAHEA